MEEWSEKPAVTRREDEVRRVTFFFYMRTECECITSLKAIFLLSNEFTNIIHNLLS